MKPRRIEKSLTFLSHLSEEFGVHLESSRVVVEESTQTVVYSPAQIINMATKVKLRF